jgi:Holliday junction resolvasome RuvABC endonuclease subunit
MLILGCDPSLTDHGWSVMDYSQPIGQQLVAFGRIKTKSKEFFTTRYAKHWNGFSDLIDQYKPDYVGMEIPPPQATYSAGLYPIWMYMAHVCQEKRIPFACWLPTSLKSYARGVLGDTGKMFKSDMVEASKIVTGTTKALNHNIADSILINTITYRFRCVMNGSVQESDLEDYEKNLLTKTLKKKTGIIEYKGMIYKEGALFYDLLDSKYDYLYTQGD